MLIAIGILFLLFLLVFLYSCCVVSGRCAENEEKMLLERGENEKDIRR